MKSTLRSHLSHVAVFALAVVLPATAIAEDERGVIDPQARAAIERLGNYVASLKTFSVALNAQLAISQGSNENTLEIAQTIKAERPNKLAFTIDSAANGEGAIHSDGKELSFYLAAFGKYMVEDAPATWDAIFQNQLAMVIAGPGNATPITTALLADKPTEKLLATIVSAKYGGKVKLGDIECDLVEAVGSDLAAGLEFKLWIDAGDKPLVRQFVPDMEKLIAKRTKQSRGNANIKVVNTVKFKDWQVDPQLPPDTFAFKVPEGAEKADSVAEMLGRSNRGEGPHPLLAKAAPAVKLDLLGGGKLDLAALKDKVVILDFWATWCGPCQRAMPIIEKVAAEYKDKGVQLYAVNIQESAADVQKFVDESGLKLTIAMDTDAAVARAYQANSIPQTVLVGKDGTVQVVHVGLSPDLENQLKKELDALVAGKDLAADAKAKSKTPAAAAASEEKEGK